MSYRLNSIQNSIQNQLYKMKAGKKLLNFNI